MHTQRKRLELETNDFLFLRLELKRLTEAMVDEEAINPLQRKEGKLEMESWLNKVFSDFTECIQLVDNPNFNMNDLLTIEEPINEDLENKVLETKTELEALTKEIVERRERMTHLLTDVIASMVEDETREALYKAQSLETLHEHEPSNMDKDVMKLIANDYDQAMDLLAQLDKTVAPNVSKFDSISRVLDST
ncbi:hypothetical protein INT47_012357 [Mucor saturninus]|uniref:Uncharacterized protein n=1 Tax=Mucor saturninus TaxID=64648 RepID=A0A8H7UVW2_9FUNG|nr:hypothetical protein INT47_012357 [Mucor saturninus]